MMKRLLPNPRRFARGYILTVLERQTREICEGLGEARLKWCIENGRAFSSLVSEETVAQYRKLAPSFHWAESAITDEEFRGLLPEWVKVLVARNGEKGEAWLRDTIAWTRGFFNALG